MTPGAAIRIAACVLAAGAGRRMGAPKADLRLAGRTFLEHWLETLRAAAIAPRFVVAAPDAEHLRAACEAHAAQLLVNLDPERGMLSSLHVCLQALRAAGAVPVDGLLVAPVDCPRVRLDTVAALARAFADSGAPIVVPRFRTRRGHPTIFAARLFDELLQAPLDVGARAVVRAHAADRVELDVDDPGVLDDIDTPGDLERLDRP
jgi:nicotine blue oxidoreductase